MKILLLVFALGILLGYTGSGQHLIGVDKNMMTSLVRKEMKNFNPDRSAKNQTFNYLKFVNSAGTKTLIVFFNDKNISTHTRLICDNSELEFVRIELNKAYTKTAENKWEYKVDNNKIGVILEKKEWYFVVNTKKSN